MAGTYLLRRPLTWRVCLNWASTRQPTAACGDAFAGLFRASSSWARMRARLRVQGRPGLGEERSSLKWQ